MNKKLATLLVPLMLMLVASFAYAQWTDSVFINATATTGDVELRITDFGVCSQSPGPSWTGVGSWGEAEEITVTVTNTYPGWYAYVCLQVKNTGTITIKMHSIKIEAVSGAGALMDYYRFAIPTGNTWCGISSPIYWLDSFSWWSTERLYSALGIPTITIAPGATYVLGGYFDLRSDTPQWENTALTIKITLKAIQAVP